MESWFPAVVGGSGLYQLSELTGIEELAVDTPFGIPSGPIITGKLRGVKIAFLARHGRAHQIGPSQVNYRANVYALKKLGCTDIVSFSACGSLRHAHQPGQFVVIDQYIDRSFARQKSFFGEEAVAHVSMAQPVCQRLSEMAFAAGQQADCDIKLGATYLVMEGPQFSTRAESELYRSWGCDVIGMTNMPEAKLAREAGMPYASIGMVTDYDCWREATENVQVVNVLQVLQDNAKKAQLLLLALCEMMRGERKNSPAQIETVLARSMVTDPNAIEPELRKKLSVILDWPGSKKGVDDTS